MPPGDRRDKASPGRAATAEPLRCGVGQFTSLTLDILPIHQPLAVKPVGAEAGEVALDGRLAVASVALALAVRAIHGVAPEIQATLGPLIQMEDAVEQLVGTFEAPDPARFPALSLAYAALDSGPSATICLNAANEVAAAAFLAGHIPFPRIVTLVEKILAVTDSVPIASVEEALYHDQQVRNTLRKDRPFMLEWIAAGLHYAWSFVTILSVIVFVHEFGH
ncbi:MAG: hypothetical protein HC901_02925, partial [Bdellovibrionaceae bacterium]|nr:hypothetical protein [Pseudobdellovibrionaceae bacterium]